MEPGRTRRLVDWETGEVMYALVPIKTVRREGRFFMAMMAAFDYLAKHPLPPRTRRVLDYLFSRLDFENYIHVEQRQIAEDLGLQRSHVSTAIRQLVERGILYRGPKAGKTGTYRLSPQFAWRGTAKGHEVALAEARRKWGQASVGPP